MATTPITALTNEASPATADLVVIVDDVAGTPTTKKATLGTLPVSTPQQAAITANPGTILGCTAYNPGTIALYNAAGSTYADIDATNLAVTFTAPASGNVLVRLAGSAKTASNNEIGWGIREGTTDLEGGLVLFGASSAMECHCVIEFRLTGVSAGSHTYKASQARVFGSGTVTTRVGGTSAEAGPFVLTVIALP